MKLSLIKPLVAMFGSVGMSVLLVLIQPPCIKAKQAQKHQETISISSQSTSVEITRQYDLSI